MFLLWVFLAVAFDEGPDLLLASGSVPCPLDPGPSEGAARCSEYRDVLGSLGTPASFLDSLLLPNTYQSYFLEEKMGRKE